MALVYIIVAILIGLGISKLYHPKSLTEKMLFSFGIPIVLAGIIELIIGFLFNWNGYLMGSASVLPFIGCVSLIITLLIVLKRKNDEKHSEKSHEQK